MSASRRAFTLLEIVLTLSMSVVLMTLIGATFRFYANSINVRDLEIRRVHLATSILQMIGDDLRASLYGSTFDASSLDTFLAGLGSSQLGAVAGALDPAAAATLGTDSTGTAAASITTTEEPLDLATTDLISTANVLTKPGLIANANQLQFDISRLPRLERWSQPLAQSSITLNDVPSDIKTVTYYVQAAGLLSGVSDPLQAYLPTTPATTAQYAPSGLVRRELDRAATNYASETGGITQLLNTGELISSEVTAISFEYYDGTVWQTTWNSDGANAMPKAVRITLTMNDSAAPVEPNAIVAGPTRTFTHTVLLPVGLVVQPAAPTEPEATTEPPPEPESTSTTDTN